MSKSKIICPNCNTEVVWHEPEAMPRNCTCGRSLISAKKDEGDSKSLLWLLLVFAPIPFGIFFLSPRGDGNIFVGLAFYILNGLCCYFGIGGFLKGFIKTPSVRILATLLLGAALFIFNLIVSIFIGCSR